MASDRKNSIPLYFSVSLEKWSFEIPKMGSKYPLKWRVTKSPYQIRRTTHRIGLWLKKRVISESVRTLKIITGVEVKILYV